MIAKPDLHALWRATEETELATAMATAHCGLRFPMSVELLADDRRFGELRAAGERSDSGRNLCQGCLDHLNQENEL